MPRVLGEIDRYTIYLVAAIAGIAIIIFWQLMVALIFAGSIAVIALPLHKRFSGRVGVKASAALITLVAFLIFVAVIALAVGLLLQNQEFLNGLVSTIINWAGPGQNNSITTALHINQTQLDGLIGNSNQTINQWADSIIGQIPALGFQLLVFFLSFSVFLYKGEELYNSSFAMLPEKLKEPVKHLTHTAVDTLYAIYVVQLIIVIVTFILALPFFYFLGFEHVLFFSSLAGLLKIVPILGPSILMAFLAVYAISISDMTALALLIFIGYPVVCAFLDLFIRPVLMGRRTCIHPVIMWIGFVGGLYTLGLVGFVLGPLTLVLLITGYHILKGDHESCGAGRTAETEKQ
ncbi:MAG: AI-2E family transporter [Methanomicrobiales archaeon]